MTGKIMTDTSEKIVNHDVTPNMVIINIMEPNVAPSALHVMTS